MTRLEEWSPLAVPNVCLFMMSAKNPAMLKNCGDFCRHNPGQRQQQLMVLTHRTLAWGADDPSGHCRVRSYWCPTPWLSFSLGKMEAATPDSELQWARHQTWDARAASLSHLSLCGTTVSAKTMPRMRLQRFILWTANVMTAQGLALHLGLRKAPRMTTYKSHTIYVPPFPKRQPLDISLKPSCFLVSSSMCGGLYLLPPSPLPLPTWMQPGSGNEHRRQIRRSGFNSSFPTSSSSKSYPVWACPLPSCPFSI